MKSLVGNRYAQLAMLAAAFALCVAVFGAFVRLSNAGLSCPDWPLCYGEITWPTHEAEVAEANAAFPDRPVETHKAWREQVHRFLAGILILATFTLAFLGWKRRTEPGFPSHAALFASGLIVFQALLGMWTVTWKLKPVVVMGHLLGGFATFALLVWIAARSAGFGFVVGHGVRRTLIVVAIVLVGIQIALGGWVSSNYAALACGMEFPRCLGEWWPATDFREGFVLWRGIGVDYEGGVLDGPARTAIHLTHRLFAILVFGHVAALAARALRTRGWRKSGVVLLALLVAQIGLGVANVVTGLPLGIATAHNAVAALLLATLVLMLARITPRSA